MNKSKNIFNSNYYFEHADIAFIPVAYTGSQQQKTEKPIKYPKVVIFQKELPFFFHWVKVEQQCVICLLESRQRWSLRRSEVNDFQVTVVMGK